LFFVANRTVYELYKRDGNFRCLGEINIGVIEENPREELVAEFFAFPQESNGHLFLERP